MSTKNEGLFTKFSKIRRVHRRSFPMTIKWFLMAFIVAIFISVCIMQTKFNHILKDSVPMFPYDDLNSRANKLFQNRLTLMKKQTMMTEKMNELEKSLKEHKNACREKTTELEKLRASLKISQNNGLEPNKKIKSIKTHETLGLKASRIPKPLSSSLCNSMSHCFDFSRCSLTSAFSVYNYNDSSISTQGEKACLFIISSDNGLDTSSLVFWRDDGRNHLIHTSYVPNQDTSHKAMIISPFSFADSSFRPGFDVPVPPPWNTSIPLPELVNMKKKYLLAYRRLKDKNNQLNDLIKNIQENKMKDKVYIFKDNEPHGYKNSTFGVINSLHKDFQSQLLDCLIQGAIPVIIFPETSPFPFREMILPFAEVIDWKLASLFLDYHRLADLYFLLKSHPDSHLFHLKRQGRLILSEYFKDPLKTAVHVVRERIGLPPNYYSEFPSPNVINQKKQTSMRHMHQLPKDNKISDSFKRSFSSLHHYKAWNEVFQPFYSTPSNPWEPPSPTDAQFRSIPKSNHINKNPTSSPTNDENLNNEQFTIIFLTYNKQKILINYLKQLTNLSDLNKVIIVWNATHPPNKDIVWPDIGVEIRVIKGEKNSLNNRFLPFEAIETEAILTLDDDVHLSTKEIAIGFKVWRENRDRLVGFPSRIHRRISPRSSWAYDTLYSSKVSLILTGAAFFHKYYTYIYTYEMPQSIRDKVDELMNCEDIAMNFLVSHVNRKPPIKVLNRSVFQCSNCPVSLSNKASHYNNRSRCINIFRDLYGYMPLLYSQYRAEPLI